MIKEQRNKPGDKGDPDNGLVCWQGVCRGKGWCGWRCYKDSFPHVQGIDIAPGLRLVSCDSLPNDVLLAVTRGPAPAFEVHASRVLLADPERV
jgi:hypothetical protein